MNKETLQLAGIFFIISMMATPSFAQKIGLHVDPSQTVLVGQDTSGAGEKMIWYADKGGAFRAGAVIDIFGNQSSYWDPANVGIGSTAFGLNSLAEGLWSMTWGFDNRSQGTGSTTWGGDNIATSQYETVFGRFAHLSSIQEALGFQGLDQLLAVGNGFGDDNRNNAFTILKNGRIGVNHPMPEAMLHIDSAGTSGERTILLALSSVVSKRPSIQFGENFRAGGPTAGMSIEYDGRSSGTENKLNINSTNSDPLVIVKNDGDTEIKGYTKLGSGAPAIKFKKIVTNQSLSTGLSVVVNHGLTGSKILDISAKMSVSETIGQSVVNYIIPANSPYPVVNNSSSSYEYSVYGDDSLIYIRAIGSAASGNKTITITIMYEE